MAAKFRTWLKRLMGICPYCGYARIEKGSRYCNICGRNLKTGKRYNEK